MYQKIPEVPQREHFQPIVNARLFDFYGLSDQQDREDFQKRELEELSSQINQIPVLPFGEAREREILRLTQYYEAFSTLFGVDLREVARTRTQINSTVMYTSPLLLQAMFQDKERGEEQGRTFFESRIQVGGFSFNATSINIINGYSFGFSVLKCSRADSTGPYEINYPAVSLPRMVFGRLKKWHASSFPNTPFDENLILSYIADTFSYRIHDWIHQAILYDADSTTRIFQKWSDDSYFVEHFFSDPSMINYEFMSDKIHYLVWQQLFKESLRAKDLIFQNAVKFMGALDLFHAWMMETDEERVNDHENKLLIDYLAYVGFRGLFNIIPIDELQETLKEHRYFLHARKLLPEKYLGYLAKLYEPLDQLTIPFRKETNAHLSLQQIIDEYVNGLREEFQVQRLMSISGELWRLGAENKLQGLLLSLPGSITQQLNEKADIRSFDPRIFNLLNNMIGILKSQVGNKVLDKIISRIEVDVDGYFYLSIDQDEVDTSPLCMSLVDYAKEAILTQLPWDNEHALSLVLKRSQNVVADQVGAVSKINPGELILINVANKTLAHNLLREVDYLKTSALFNVFWKRVSAERSRGHVSLGDMYPYDFEKARSIFLISAEDIQKDNFGNLILKTGYYATAPAKRRVARLIGPLSMDAGYNNERRRVLYGGIAKNHVMEESLDIFPVDAASFDLFYHTNRFALPALKVSEPFVKRMGFKSIDQANDAIKIILESLEVINSARIHGYRGKPQAVKLLNLIPMP
jgi:hypothetical protein